MKTLVLIIDDDNDIRDNVLPEFVSIRLNADYATARDVESGIKLLAEHGPDSDRPASLVILDMHMPQNQFACQVAKDAGSQVVVIKNAYNLHCTTVIFTAYPKFEDCVASIKAGAYAYIPKFKIENEGGIEQLERVCHQIIKNISSTAVSDSFAKFTAPPSDSWFQNNYHWLQEEFDGKWVSFIPEELIKDFKIILNNDVKLRDELFVISGTSYNDVFKKIMIYPSFYKVPPPIVAISKIADGEKGDA